MLDRFGELTNRRAVNQRAGDCHGCFFWLRLRIWSSRTLWINPNYAPWYTNNHSVIGHALKNDRIHTYQRMITDRNPTDNFCSGSNVDVPTNRGHSPFANPDRDLLKYKTVRS